MSSTACGALRADGAPIRRPVVVRASAPVGKLLGMLADQLQAKLDAGDVPPNLTQGTAVARCQLCKHWEPGAAECLLYGFPTRASEVCDDFEDLPGADVSRMDMQA